MQFVHLHVHSHGSLLDSTALPKNLAKRAKDLGMPALTLTDHGNVFNAIEFYEACLKEGVKPILGCEFNFVESCFESKQMTSRGVEHLVLLAENDEGWHNLIKLISLSNSIDAFYYRPRIDLAMLQAHPDGLIALTACAGGVVAAHLRERRDDNGDIFDHYDMYRADAAVRMFKGIFGDKLFLEVLDTNSDSQHAINDGLRKLALKHGLKTVASCNVHYTFKEDLDAHHTLTQIAARHVATSFGEVGDNDQYLKGVDELSSDILPSEIAMTVSIADMCNVIIDLDKERLPVYPFVPDGQSAMEFLRELVRQGAQQKMLPAKSNADEYRQRAQRELDDIDKLGFADYFLIVWDVIGWAKQQNILVAPGRGSVGGSLVSYLLSITDIDPLQYGLIWERFLNVGRKSLPDIDTDMPRSKRSLVLDYIRTRFGEDNVAQLVTFNKLAPRAVMKDVFKVFGMDFEEANQITRLVPAKGEDHVPVTLDEAIRMTPALQVYEDKYKAWFKIARSLEGRNKSLGTHAAAVVISDTPFNQGNYPLCRSADSKSLVFAWDMDIVDKLRLLKLDVLGLTTLDVIQDTFDLIEERHNTKLSMDTIPLDDNATYDLLCDGKTVGVFQLEKQLGKTWSKMLKPRSIEEVSDLISLLRPGPLESGMADNYRDVGAGQKIPSYPHDSLKPILDKTRGSLVYQEQIIQICRDLAKMSLVDADMVRRAMSKKKPEEMKKWKAVFVDGCGANNIGANDALEIWGWIEKFAGYGFPKAHGIGYGLLAYYTAFLKANYTDEFFCACLRNAQYAQNTAGEIRKFVHDAKLFNIQVIPPRATKGNIDFDIIDKGCIAFGLSSLKNVGEKAIPGVRLAANGATGFDDFVKQAKLLKINRRVMEAMIQSGALDEFKMPRTRMMASYELFNALTANERLLLDSIQQAWVDTVREVADDEKVMAFKERGLKIPHSGRRKTIRELLLGYDAVDLFDKDFDKVQWEQHFLGISLTASITKIFHARNTCSDVINYSGQDMPVDLAVHVANVKQHKTKKGPMMAFMTAGDETYELDNFVIFPALFAKFSAVLEVGNILRVRGRVDDRGSVIVNHLEKVR